MKVSLLVVFLFLGGLLEGQQLSVKSFRKLENDLSARGSEGRTDQNGDKCAIIKIVTTETGFVFEPDALGMAGSVQKTGEVWLYVPYGAKRLTVKHPQLGVLRNYVYPERIDQACVYEMVLISGRVETVVHEQVTKQYWVIIPEPPEAVVYVDEEYAGTGTVYRQLPLGRHTYRVECPMYHTQAGTVELTAEKKSEQQVRLKPAFGYVEIRTEPQSGAQVFMDDEPLEELTPCRSRRLKSGMHRIKVVQPMYKPAVREVKVEDEQIAQVSILMEPNFGEVTVTGDPEAVVWINGEKRSIGRWKGRLEAGLYTVELKKPSYRNRIREIVVEAGQTLTVEMEEMEPVYGILDLRSEPAGAGIRIDGREYGVTPVVLNELLVGEHRVKLRKEGYKESEMKVVLDESDRVWLKVILEKDNGYLPEERSTTTGYTEPPLRQGLRIGEKYRGGVVFAVSDNGFHGKVVSATQGNHSQTAHERYAAGYDQNGLKWRLPSPQEMEEIYRSRGRLGIGFENQWYWTSGTKTVFGMGNGKFRGKVPPHITYPAVYVAEF